MRTTIARLKSFAGWQDEDDVDRVLPFARDILWRQLEDKDDRRSVVLLADGVLDRLHAELGDLPEFGDVVAYGTTAFALGLTLGALAMDRRPLGKSRKTVKREAKS